MGLRTQFVTQLCNSTSDIYSVYWKSKFHPTYLNMGTEQRQLPMGCRTPKCPLQSMERDTPAADNSKNQNMAHLEIFHAPLIVKET